MSEPTRQADPAFPTERRFLPFPRRKGAEGGFLVRQLVLLALILVCAPACLCSETARQPDDVQAIAQLKDSRIVEASGIAASRKHPGHFYIVNDSGDAPRVFLVDRAGATRLVIRMRGAAAVDYEDIALAPGNAEGGFDVCVADIGDNSARRPYVTIYRFAEPALPAEASAEIEVEPRAIRFRYESGPANAEALAVDPKTGDGYIFTKRSDGKTHLFRLPAPWPETQAALPLWRELALPPARPIGQVVTAADFSPDGRRLAVRSYLNGWEWRLPASGEPAGGTSDGTAGDVATVEGAASGTAASGVTELLSEPPHAIILAAEQQGEALCYSHDGEAIVTISEGREATLYERRVDPP